MALNIPRRRKNVYLVEQLFGRQEPELRVVYQSPASPYCSRTSARSSSARPAPVDLLNQKQDILRHLCNVQPYNREGNLILNLW